MKTTALRLARLAALLFVLPVFAAETASSVPSKSDDSASSKSVAGDFAGTWKGAGDSGGKLRLKLKPAGAEWAGEASFTFQDAEVSAKVKSIKVDGTKVVLVLEYT